MYLVAWTGGYEEPQYFASPKENEAGKKALEWFGQIHEGDSIQLLNISETGEVRVLAEYYPIELA